MGTGKHAIQKKQHRERSQPLHRRKYGLLEKHKDYVQRARDFHSKEDRLNTLRNKAADRNKDEFYFGMINSRTERGVHVQSRGNEVLSNDFVKLLKTQDVKYIQTARAAEEKKIQKLRERLGAQVDLDFEESNRNAQAAEDLSVLGLLKPDYQSSKPSRRRKSTDQLNHGKKTLFVDSFDDAPKKGTRHSSTGQNNKAESELDAKPQETEPELQKALITELKARIERLEKLRQAERDIELQRNLMGKGKKLKITKSKEEHTSEESEDDDAAFGKQMKPKSRLLFEEDKKDKPKTVFKFKRERRR